jgi:flavin reductase (DIM6/NTAB) family NADH-FMN oxidoreductase RutF
MMSNGSGKQTSPFDVIMASAEPNMIVVTSAEGGERAGCLVGFHAQSSIDPVRYTVWLSKANHTYRVALRASHIAVHFLTEDDLALGERFGTLSGDVTDKFVGLAATDGPGNVPLLEDCPNRFTARRVALLDEGGDHVCLVAQIVQSWTGGQFTPLTFTRVRHLQPGHGNEERPSPPTERDVSARTTNR